MTRGAGLPLIGVFLAASLQSQTAGPGMIGPRTGGIGSSSQSSSTNADQQFRLSQIPAFLSGTVVLEGGAGPAENVAIQRVCGGTPRTVAYTNNKGQFSFQWGSSAGISEASDSGFGGGTRTDDAGPNAYRIQGAIMQGCELVAGAPGFRPARLDLSMRRSTDNPELGMIVLHRIEGVQGTSVSVTSMLAPKEAKKAREKGVELLRSGNPSDTAAAEKQFAKAVGIYPKYANAWLDLGRARLRQRADTEAQAAFQSAIDADDKLVEPYLELGRLASRRQDWPNAARYLDRALQLDPVDYPHLWFDDAVANYNIRDLDRAERNARQAIKIHPPVPDPRATRLLGFVLRDKQDYAGADEALRTYLRLSPDAKDIDLIKNRLDEIDSHLTTPRP